LDLQAVLQGVVAAAEREGAALRAEFFRPGGARGRKAKAPIDTEIERRLRVALQALVPCAFGGEETGTTPAPEAGGIDGWVWLVDPHDGTSEFLLGRRGSAISIALLRGPVPVLGVVHCPLPPDGGPDTLAWAEGCGPVRRNGHPLEVDLSQRGFAPGELVWATATSAFRPAVYSRIVAPARYVAMPSIAYRLARVAAGDGIATLSIHEVSEYDVAAGIALVRASRGAALTAAGEEIVLEGRADAIVKGCFAGAPAAALRLSRFDWPRVQDEERAAVRIAPMLVKVDDEVRLERAQGCLLGQAVGDSLGTRVECRTAAEIAVAYPHGVRDLVDGGPLDLIAGQPSDDTELALVLARTLVREKGYEASAVLGAYRRWLAGGAFTVGRTTRRGLEGTPDVASASNGSLMRIAPIGVWSAGEPAEAARVARIDSALTHPHPACVEACAGFTAAIAEGVHGGSRESMVATALEHARGEARHAIERGAGGDKPGDFITHAGWVLIALQNAFYRLMAAPTLEEGIVATIGEGGDTDTNAAIAGALLGAFHGRASFPRRWVLPVLACRPHADAGARRPRPMEYWPDDILEVAEALLALSREAGSVA
jgi:ADP-ribosylglycohydrolase/fructose-1,6-bisphosphatase/inositol monophosphatase family enzyme